MDITMMFIIAPFILILWGILIFASGLAIMECASREIRNKLEKIVSGICDRMLRKIFKIKD